MIYLTYNDAPSGIYNSQVIDVVNYLNTLSDKKVKLVAFISIRNFFLNKRKIVLICSNALVIPMFPKASNWMLNYYSLFIVMLFHKKNNIMARGPFATNLALRIKKNGLCKKVIFDARGAYYAEITEYNVIADKNIQSTIADIEQKAINKSDYKLAVSEALVNYWAEQYGYKKTNHVVIPCTLNSVFAVTFPTEQEILDKRIKLGYTQEDIIFIYSGSTAGWQSFDSIDNFMYEYLKYPNVKLIILSNHFDPTYKIMQSFSDKVLIQFLEPDKVKDLLLIADYGILFREQSITNKVASPVKFAEYISCGLKIVISKSLGDYSEFVEKEKIGFYPENFSRLPYLKKLEIHRLSKTYFFKENYKENYCILLNQ